MRRKRNKRDWTFAGLALIVFALVASFSYLEKGLAAGAAFYVFYTIVQTKAETHKESLNDKRFWFVFAILVVIHIAAIAIIKFPEMRAGLVALPFALIDGFVMWWLINWIERRFLSERGHS